MSAVTLTVNGKSVTEPVEPRLHLADFVREKLLLTGTHIGCEQGVCGACTILIDGEPARSCTAFAIACEGSSVQTIEGLVDDPVIVHLRAAFKAEHALQCGYCTPGMLVTARDIVLRLPAADEARIRTELAGNLCRCTGYAGIVRAIQRVLKQAPAVETVISAPKPVIMAARPSAQATVAAPAAFAPQLAQSLRLAVPLDTAWAAILDPALIASCVPGASITRAEAGKLEGEMAVALGPIKARFSGSATVSYEDGHRGMIAGEGRDSLSGTRLKATTRFQALADGPDACRIELAIEYALTGALAQFSRGPVVKAFADALAAQVARNIDARLTGAAVEKTPPRLGLGRMLFAALLRLVGLR